MTIRTPADLPSYRPWDRKESYDTSLNTVCTYIRVLDHLGKIVEGLGVEEPKEQGTTEHGAFRPHLATYLKLLLTVSYARNASLKIGSKFTRKLYYLDILSASGLTYPQGSKQPLPGSCFCVSLALQEFEKAQTPPSLSFSKMWAFDSSAPRLEALRRRHTLLQENAGFRLPQLSIVAGDANVTLPGVLDALAKERRQDFAGQGKPSLSLAFIDNVGLDVRMETVDLIQRKIRADLVVHLPLRAIWRSINQARKTPAEAQALTAFFGTDDAWKTINDVNEIPAAYESCIQLATNQKLQSFTPVHIKSANQEFALCIFARRTAGMTANQPGWVASIRHLADACNGITPELLASVLKVASRKQATLGD